MNFIQVVLGVTGFRQAGQFNRSCREARATQERLLLRILELNAGTEYGKRHHFSSIRSIEDYQRGVSPNSYKDLEPYILRAAEGEPQQLTMDPPTLFATTSGTTGEPKFIPITKSSRRDKSLAMRLWLYHAAQDHPEMFAGQILAVVSPEIEGHTKSGIPYGAESGHAYRNMPAVTQSAYAIPYEVFALEDYESKYYTILRLAAAKDISMIGTCNPSTILLLAKKLDEHKERILKDIYVGGVDHEAALPEDLRRMLEAQLPPDPDRSQRLEQYARKEGRLLPRDVWPNLALIGCWKGGSVGLYLREFDGLFDPSTPIRDWGYLASEVRGSVPLVDEGCSGVLAVETNFYEFVEESDADSAAPEFLTADQIEKGGHYFVYPTTTGGLYRYEMNDLIRVTGFHEGAPVVEFVQKGKGVSSLTGEKLYEAQVCEAVRTAEEVDSRSFEFVVATPEWGEPPRYVFLVEESEGPIPERLWKQWIDTVDRKLSKLNDEYAVKRKSGRLGPPAIKLLVRGEYHEYRRRRVAAGVPDGQFKMLKLNPDLEFQNEFKQAKTLAAD